MRQFSMMNLYMKQLMTDKSTGIKYLYDSMKQERVNEVEESRYEMKGMGLLSNLITKLASSGASKKVASVMTSKATKDIAIRVLRTQ